MSMTTQEKLDMVKAILRIDDSGEDALISTYLNFAGRELLAWRYSHAKEPPEAVPDEYEMTQVQAVINGYTQSGIEGQILSVENGIHRHFKYSDMVEYIRNNVIPIAGVLRSTGVPEYMAPVTPDPDPTPDTPDEPTPEQPDDTTPTDPEQQGGEANGTGGDDP